MMQEILNLLMSWVLVSIIVVGGITLRCIRPKMTLQPYEDILEVGIWLLTIHALHVLCCISFFPERREFDWGAPYGLLYPALLYFGVKTAGQGKHLHKRTWLLHSLPFIIASFVFIYLLLAGIHKDDFPFVLYRTYLYRLMIAFFLLYGIWAWFNPSKIELLSLKALLNTSVLMLVLVGLLFFATSSALNNQSSVDRYLPRLMIYCMMLALMVLLFRHKLFIVKYIDPYEPDRPSRAAAVMIRDSDKVTTPAYGKSAIADEKLVIYEEKIKAAMIEEQLFLDPQFGLDRLAEHMHVPKHHLSQVFSIRFGKGFTGVLGELRINYALALLQKTDEKINIENLAYECGFNSKVSFNRHFKQLVGTSPSAYRKKLIARAKR